MPGSMFDYGSGGPDAPPETREQYEVRMEKLRAELERETVQKRKRAERETYLAALAPPGSTLPACVDCRFRKMYEVAMGGALAGCRHPLAQVQQGNIVDGFRLTAWTACETVRQNPQQCGPEGRWWVKVSLWRRLFR